MTGFIPHSPTTTTEIYSSKNTLSFDNKDYLKNCTYDDSNNIEIDHRDLQTSVLGYTTNNVNTKIAIAEKRHDSDKKKLHRSSDISEIISLYFMPPLRDSGYSDRQKSTMTQASDIGTSNTLSQSTLATTVYGVKHTKSLSFQSRPTTLIGELSDERKNANSSARKRTTLKEQNNNLSTHNDYDNANFLHPISPECTHQKSIYSYSNIYDKRKLSSALKKLFQPYKTVYELEWNMPNYVHKQSSRQRQNSRWLSLDGPTSSGMDRVRLLGHNELQVRLDDQLTQYINALQVNCCQLQEIVMDVFFDNNYKNYGPDRYSKGTISTCNSTCSAYYKAMSATLNHMDMNNTTASPPKEIQLLKLRRVRWWKKSYTSAQTCLPTCYNTT